MSLKISYSSWPAVHLYSWTMINISFLSCRAGLLKPLLISFFLNSYSIIYRFSMTLELLHSGIPPRNFFIYNFFHFLSLSLYPSLSLIFSLSLLLSVPSSLRPWPAKNASYAPKTRRAWSFRAPARFLQCCGPGVGQLCFTLLYFYLFSP